MFHTITKQGVQDMVQESKDLFNIFQHNNLFQDQSLDPDYPPKSWELPPVRPDVEDHWVDAQVLPTSTPWSQIISTSDANISRMNKYQNFK